MVDRKSPRFNDHVKGFIVRGTENLLNHRIRDPSGFWFQVQNYIQLHSGDHHRERKTPHTSRLLICMRLKNLANIKRGLSFDETREYGVVLTR